MTAGCGNRLALLRPIAPRTRRALGYAVVAVLGTIAVYHLHQQLPRPGEIVAVLRAADITWLIAAGLAILASLDMFARHQRTLLRAVGVRLSHSRALALSYIRAAMAYSLPAGSIVSATYAFRQFHVYGADRRSAATVLALSSVLLASALSLLYAVGLIASTVLDLPLTPILPSNLIAVVTAAGATLAVVTAAVIRLAARSVAARYWTLALTAALANWSAELLCLVFVARALELNLGIIPLAATFLSAQLVRQIPLTPGGIGLIEASLLTGLIAAGATATSAAAAVLAYRLLSCWLVVKIGLLSWLYLRNTRGLNFLARGASLGE